MTQTQIGLHVTEGISDHSLFGIFVSVCNISYGNSLERTTDKVGSVLFFVIEEAEEVKRGNKV